VQGIWRLSEWVATPAATILAVYFLPKFSQLKENNIELTQTIKQSAIFLMGISGLLYLIIFRLHEEIFPQLYNSAFKPNSYLLMIFLIGDWLRIASWIFLFYFYAKGSIKVIVIGEFLSLPLFAGLLSLNNTPSLEWVGNSYLCTYLSYLIFNFFYFMKTNNNYFFLKKKA
jgi:O-antigen/teichoic acid export membrane protein